MSTISERYVIIPFFFVIRIRCLFAFIYNSQVENQEIKICNELTGMAMNSNFFFRLNPWYNISFFIRNKFNVIRMYSNAVGCFDEWCYGSVSVFTTLNFCIVLIGVRQPATMAACADNAAYVRDYRTIQFTNICIVLSIYGQCKIFELLNSIARIGIQMDILFSCHLINSFDAILFV